MIFLALALLALVGGLLHAPNNYDALTYRIPRVLHWLDEGQWHWVHSQNARVNTRVCGMEWLSAPLLALTGTDRGVFLTNLLSFLLLPGLCFSLFTRLQVRTRVAWHWMWVLPAGYNFVLQAGSVGNDTLGAVYALAAVDFALRARVSGRVWDVWFSVLAAALLTSSKLSNLPLLLPWAIALLPSVRLPWGRPVASLLIGLLAALASFLPTAGLNLKHGADWSGASLEDSRFVMKNPLLGVAGNTLVLVHQNFAPPLFPVAPAWNEFAPGLLPAQFRIALANHFESGFLKLGELPGEETAGLGLGVCGLLAVSLAAAWRWRRRSAPASSGPVGGSGMPDESRFLSTLCGSFFVALLVFMTQSGLFCPARIITPYYPFLFAPCLLGAAHAAVVRCRAWRTVAALAGWLAVVVAVLTPARPLWPAETILGGWREKEPESRFLSRAHTVYAVYRERADSLAPLRQWLPPETRTIGFISSGDDPETSLWRPFGQRRVVHILPDDDVSTLSKQGVYYVVIGAFGLERQHHQTIEQWVARHEGRIVGRAALMVKVAQGVQEWYVVRVGQPKPRVVAQRITNH